MLPHGTPHRQNPGNAWVSPGYVSLGFLSLLRSDPLGFVSLPRSETVGFSWSFRIRRPQTTEEIENERIALGLRSPKLARLEAALFVANEALSPRKLAQVALLADPTEARTLVRQLNDLYDRFESSFRVEQVASGFQLLTRPEFCHWLGKLHHRQSELKLSQSALETLTIIAYRQPIIRADIEAIRGVNCTEILKQLLDRGYVRIAGADDSLGRPHLYETTRKFLEIFGLKSLSELPVIDRSKKEAA